MNLGAEALTAAQTGLRAAFNQGMREALEGPESEKIERLMDTAPSSNSTERHPISTLLGDLEEVLDEVTIINIGSWIQNVDNKTYAGIVEVDRDDIADDNLGVYRPTAIRVGRRAQLYPLRLAVEALENAFTTEWIDDNPVFYAGARAWPVGSVTWQNRYDLTLNADNFETLYDAQLQRQGPHGRNLGFVPDVLWYGPQNRSAAEDVLDKEQLSSGESNNNYKRVDHLMLPELTGNEWGVAVTAPVKGMVLQDREGPDFVAQEEPSSHAAMYQEKFGFKGRRRCAVAFLAPWLMTASNGGE